FSGVDNLYILDPKSGEIRELTSVAYGAYDPFVDRKNQRVFFMNDAGRDLDIRSLDLQQERGRPIKGKHPKIKRYFEPLRETISASIEQDTAERTNFATRPYNHLSGLFNFHS